MTARVDGAVQGDLLGRNLLHRDHGMSVTSVRVEHRAEQPGLVDHDVVGQQHCERLVPDVMTTDRYRVPETERITLAYVVEVGEVRRDLHLLQ